MSGSVRARSGLSSVHDGANSTIAAPGTVKRCGSWRDLMTDVTKSGHRDLVQGYCPASSFPIRKLGDRLAYCSGVRRFVVEVMLKPEIHDPQGEAIASASRRLGFSQVVQVRQGKRFEIELSEPTAEERISELAAELLANPVIEEFSVHPA
jgi:phosphoribosylformylglycinamidine synthase subunit PurS